jgi:prolyl oligopeptidase family protein
LHDRPLRAFGCLVVALTLAGCSRSTGAQKASAPPQTVPSSPPSVTWQFSDPAFTALPGSRALYGRLGNALYEIEVPGNWNGQLVLYAHGFDGFEPFLIVNPPSLRQHFISQGFAWGASSFSANGYDPQDGVDDTLALLDYFKGAVGAPSRVYLDGESMGGHVVVASLEQHPGIYSGALSECGVVAGVKEMDYLLSYAAVGSYLAGLDLLPVKNLDAYRNSVSRYLVPALGDPTTKTLTAKGRIFEGIIENLTGGPRPFRHEGFLDRFPGDFTITFDDLGRHTVAARAASNQSERYTLPPGSGISESELNAKVYRQAPDPSVRNSAAGTAFAPFTGKLMAPLLAIHTTGDAFVPISMEQDYRRAVEEAGRGDLLVQRAIRRPDHCQFTPPEREGAWDDLVRWVETGAKPAGDDLLTQDLSRAGLEWTHPLLPGDPGGL